VTLENRPLYILDLRSRGKTIKPETRTHLRDIDRLGQSSNRARLLRCFQEFLSAEALGPPSRSEITRIIPGKWRDFSENERERERRSRVTRFTKVRRTSRTRA